MVALLSPLRYPGSKRRLAFFIEKALLINNFFPKLYVEPFVGGGSVGLHLLQKGLVEKVIFVDADPWISSFWNTVFWDTEWLIEQILNAKITLDNWHNLKQSNPSSRRQQAWACLFLNRTSFSGILHHRVGPLGGRSQNSPYKIDCRFPRTKIIERIRKISNFKDRIYGIWNLSWDESISLIQDEQKNGNLPREGVFYYFDPPFFQHGEELYRYYFTIGDHIQLRDKILQMQDKWLLSYDLTEEVETLYGNAVANRHNGTKKTQVNIMYTVSTLNERKRGREIILSNLETLPEFTPG